MSSTYVTSTDLNLIGRLLAEARENDLERDDGTETASARILIRAVEQGISDEDTLRALLLTQMGRHRPAETRLQQWEDEGGARLLAACSF